MQLDVVGIKLVPPTPTPDPHLAWSIVHFCLASLYTKGARAEAKSSAAASIGFLTAPSHAAELVTFPIPRSAIHGERYRPSMEGGREEASAESGQRTSILPTMVAVREETRAKEEEGTFPSSMAGGC